MTDFQQWDQRLHRELTELRTHSQQLAAAVAAVRGHGEVPGVRVEVDADGAITDLHIASAAMRWAGSRLTDTLIECHRKARTEARAKIERVVARADPRIRDQVQRALATHTPGPDINW
jgi:hypothetical protein